MTKHKYRLVVGGFTCSGPNLHIYIYIIFDLASLSLVPPSRVVRVKQRAGGQRLPHICSPTRASECSVGVRPKRWRSHRWMVWDAVVRFTKDVVSAKEETERSRQRPKGVAPSRRWRPGRTALDRPQGMTNILALHSFLF